MSIAALIAAFVAGCRADVPGGGASAPQPAPAVAVEPARETAGVEPTTTAMPAAPPRFIPQTQIADTTDNRAIIAVCERYRAATEARDKDALLALASRDYLDDAGTADPSDDVDYAGLATSLEQLLPMISDVHYSFEYRTIEWRGDRVLVDYRYDGFYRVGGIERRVADSNQLELLRDGDSFTIVAGM